MSFTGAISDDKFVVRFRVDNGTLSYHQTDKNTVAFLLRQVADKIEQKGYVGELEDHKGKTIGIFSVDS